VNTPYGTLLDPNPYIRRALRKNKGRNLKAPPLLSSNQNSKYPQRSGKLNKL
jgi:hypothetical protein